MELSRFDPMCGVGLAVGRQPSKLIYTGSIPVPRSILELTPEASPTGRTHEDATPLVVQKSSEDIVALILAARHR